MRKKECRAAIAAGALHELPGIAEWIGDFGSRRKFKFQRFSHGLQNFRFHRIVRDLGIIQQRDNRHPRVGGVKERRIFVSPVILPRPRADLPRHHALCPSIGGIFVSHFFRRPEKLRRGHQYAIIIDDILLAVVGVLQVVLLQKIKRLPWRFADTSRWKIRRTHRTCSPSPAPGDRHASTVAKADLIIKRRRNLRRVGNAQRIVPHHRMTQTPSPLSTHANLPALSHCLAHRPSDRTNPSDSSTAPDNPPRTAPHRAGGESTGGNFCPAKCPAPSKARMS